MYGIELVLLLTETYCDEHYAAAQYAIRPASMPYVEAHMYIRTHARPYKYAPAPRYVHDECHRPYVHTQILGRVRARTRNKHPLARTNEEKNSTFYWIEKIFRTPSGGIND